jgi:DNA-binding NtrC family response regulator
VRLPVETPVKVAPNEAIQTGDVVLVVQDLVPTAASAAPAFHRPSGTIAATAAPLVIDEAMKHLYALAARVARGTIGVLLTGETGVGKEVLAEFIHRSSARAAGPLVRINCAALTDSLAESELFGHEKGAFTGAQREHRGMIESADGGTLFLDEIGEIAPVVQAKLLRVVEDRHVLRVGGATPQRVDVRFIAATNRDLEAEVDAGRFRRDLYFRLAGAVLAIPPLRERPAELEILASRFAAETAATLGREPPRFTAAALAALRAHTWPGNVRELRNLVERALLVAEGDHLGVEHFPLDGRPAPAAPGPLAVALDTLERQHILDALEAHGGNQTRAAGALGMPLRTFVKRLDAYGIPRPRKR